MNKIRNDMEKVKEAKKLVLKMIGERSFQKEEQDLKPVAIGGVRSEMQDKYKALIKPKIYDEVDQSYLSFTPNLLSNI